MFRSEPMQKVRVIAFSGAKYDVIKALQSIGLVDLRKSKLTASDDRPFDGFSEVSDRLVRAEGALQILSRYKAKNKTHHGVRHSYKSPSELIKAYDSLTYITSIFRLNDELASLKEQLSELRTASSRFKIISEIDIDLKRLSQSSILSFKAFLTDDRSLEKISSLFKKSKLRYELLSSPVRKGSVSALAIFRKADEKQALELIDSSKHNDLELPHAHMTGTPSHILSELDNNAKSCSARISAVNQELLKLSNSHYDDLAAIKELLEAEYGRLGVSSEFKSTRNAFAFEGWVPKNRVSALKDRINKETGGAYELEMINDGELAPTYFNRNRFMRPFQYLMEFYSLPRSDEIDPTYIFMITLAIFYGIMVSDIGYGLVSLLIATLITRKTNPDGLLFNVSRVWQYFSISIIFFGIISNQTFGFSIAALQPLHILNWTDGISNIILLTIIMGLFQVGLGQLFSFINHWRHNERKLAISKLTSISAIAFGVLAISGLLFGALPSNITNYSLYIAVASIAITALLGNVIEDAELTNLISHPLSYMRLLGFGLASIIIASLIDMGFTPHFSQGPVLFIVYLAIFIVLHLMNIVLGMFEGVVQSARLNFAEFFSKFYKGNGVKYAPYRFKRNYTKDGE